MESSSVAGAYVSLVVAGGDYKCVCSPGSLSLGHCSIRPNWVRRGRDGWGDRVNENETGPEGEPENRVHERKKDRQKVRPQSSKKRKNKKREKKKCLSLFLIFFCAAFSSLPSWWLYQFASTCCSQIKMDASPHATVETYLQLPAFTIHQRPEEFSSPLFSSLTCSSFCSLCLSFPLLFCLAFPLSHSSLIKKSNTKVHTQTLTVQDYYLPFVGGLQIEVCAPCLSVGQSSDTWKQGTNRFIPMLPHL